MTILLYIFSGTNSTTVNLSKHSIDINSAGDIHETVELQGKSFTKDCSNDAIFSAGDSYTADNKHTSVTGNRNDNKKLTDIKMSRDITEIKDNVKRKHTDTLNSADTDKNLACKETVSSHDTSMIPTSAAAVAIPGIDIDFDMDIHRVQNISAKEDYEDEYDDDIVVSICVFSVSCIKFVSAFFLILLS